jgi:hypothetical protein
VRGLADLALRRVRLLTAFALIGVPWLIISYDLSWHAALVAAAIAAALIVAVLGAVRLSRPRGAGPRGKA